MEMMPPKDKIMSDIYIQFENGSYIKCAHVSEVDLTAEDTSDISEYPNVFRSEEFTADIKISKNWEYELFGRQLAKRRHKKKRIAKKWYKKYGMKEIEVYEN